MAAIDLYESGNNTIRCNHLSNVRDGLRFTGLACDGSFIWGNSMTGHNQGLLLRGAQSATVVGQQPKRWNTWPGGALAWEANNDNNLFLWSLSKFEVQFPETPGNIYWPQPRNPAMGWFSQVSDPGTIEDYCARGGTDEKILTTADELVLTEQYPAYKGYAATQWEAAYMLYDRLYHLPALRTPGSASEAFYSAQSSTNIGKLHSAIEQYGALSALPSSIESSLQVNYDQSTGILEQMSDKHEAMAIAASAAQQQQILQELQALGTQLQALSATKAALSATHLSERSSKISALQAYLSTIATSTVPEQNLKSVLSVLTEAMATQAGDTYTPTQIATLNAIADQCRYAGGYGVVLARVALRRQLASYNDEAMCPPVGGAQGGGEDRNQISNGSSMTFTLTPNPTAGTLQVAWGDADFSQGQLQIWDMLGTRVRSSTLQSGTTTTALDLTGLPDGHYMIEMIMDNQRWPVQHFVKHSY
ncbi:MAG TPA: T9SS type A sorting domain-containing protein [Saprospiraceae bacterium]|nr:T9SS type A sorting domain-containing protein [Saprospiraceae bacterium]